MFDDEKANAAVILRSNSIKSIAALAVKLRGGMSLNRLLESKRPNIALGSTDRHVQILHITVLELIRSWSHLHVLTDLETPT